MAAYAAIPVAYGLVMAWVLRSPRYGEYGGPLLAGLALAFSAAAMWVGRPGASRLLDGAARPAASWGGPQLAWASLVAFTACAAAAGLVLERFPISADELAYIFQAQTYAEGRLWVPAPPVSAAVHFPHLYDLDGRWVSQYLPGWPLVMTPAAALGAPLWLVDPLLAAAALVAFFALARSYVGRRTAWIGVALLAVNAFFVLTYGSYFNHGFTALAGISFALFGGRYWRDGRLRDALLAGIFLGAMGLTRPQNAAVFAAPFVACLALSASRRRGLFWFGLGGAPFLAALLAYNAALTGHPLTPVQAAMVREPLGVGRWVWFKRALQRILRLPEWTSPILLIGWPLAFLDRARRRGIDFTDWIMPLTFVGLLFYGGQGGPQFGARYFFEAWPFAILTILKAVEPALKDATKPGRAAWIASGLLAAIALQIAYMPPRMAREHRIVEEDQALYRAVAAMRLNHALVMIRDDTGKTRPAWPNELLRNGTHVETRNVIYALDRGPKNAEVLAAYPGRAAYLWAGGRLSPLAAAAAPAPAPPPGRSSARLGGVR